MNEITFRLDDELRLITRARKEPNAFADVYDHYFPRIYNYTRYRVHNAAAADDLTALIFERALAKLMTYRPRDAPFSAWLFGIARKAVSDYYRQQRDHLPLDYAAEHAAADPLPEAIIEQHETKNDLLAALARLNDHERDLLALKFAADLPHKQIAQITGMSESNVAVTIYRTLKQLRRMMSEKV